VAQQTKSWISDCLEKHPSCSSKIKVPPLPTRVIDVRGSLKHVDTDDTGDTVRLYVPKKDEVGRYATFTYSSGGKHTVLMKSVNMEQFKTSISVNSLPPALQEAIEFTRKLDIQYLWIDVLCIMQDSAQDRERECKNIGDIYTNGTINIRDNKSSDVQQRFLRTEPTQEMPSFNIVLYHPSSRKSTTITFIKTWGNGLTNSVRHQGVLYSRPWGYIESLLPPRSVSFTEYNDVVWACDQHNNGGWTSSLPVMNDSVMHTLYGNQIMHVRDFARATTAEEFAYQVSVVVDYVTRRMEDQSAERFHVLTGYLDAVNKLTAKSRCFYGLWELAMPQMLGWLNQPSLDKPGYDSFGRLKGVPSWSYLSSTGRISNLPLYFRYFQFRYAGYTEIDDSSFRNILKSKTIFRKGHTTRPAIILVGRVAQWRDVASGTTFRPTVHWDSGKYPGDRKLDLYILPFAQVVFSSGHSSDGKDSGPTSGKTTRIIKKLLKGTSSGRSSPATQREGDNRGVPDAPKVNTAPHSLPLPPKAVQIQNQGTLTDSQIRTPELPLERVDERKARYGNLLQSAKKRFSLLKGTVKPSTSQMKVNEPIGTRFESEQRQAVTVGESLHASTANPHDKSTNMTTKDDESAEDSKFTENSSTPLQWRRSMEDTSTGADNPYKQQEDNEDPMAASTRDKPRLRIEPLRTENGSPNEITTTQATPEPTADPIIEAELEIHPFVVGLGSQLMVLNRLGNSLYERVGMCNCDAAADWAGFWDNIQASEIRLV
jgi:hypothetical protein